MDRKKITSDTNDFYLSRSHPPRNGVPRGVFSLVFESAARSYSRDWKPLAYSEWRDLRGKFLFDFRSTARACLRIHFMLNGMDHSNDFKMFAQTIERERERKRNEKRWQ
jgi:hypothetical protein